MSYLQTENLRVYRTYEWVRQHVPVELLRMGGPPIGYNLVSKDIVQVQDSITLQWKDLLVVEATKPPYPGLIGPVRALMTETPK